MKDYEWPTELDTEPKRHYAVTPLSVSMQRIRDFNQRHADLRELERDSINSQIATDDAERYALYLAIAAIIGFVAILWLVAWLIT